MNEPGTKPQIFGKVGVCWRRSCDEEFRKYWTLHLEKVLPNYPELNGRVIEIGMTGDVMHVVREDPEKGIRAVMRLKSPGGVLEPRTRDFFTLAHELAHWVQDEQMADLIALTRMPRSRDIHLFSEPSPGYFRNADVLCAMGLEDVVIDLAHLALRQKDMAPQRWFENQCDELRFIVEGELR